MSCQVPPMCFSCKHFFDGGGAFRCKASPMKSLILASTTATRGKATTVSV